ncbi:MAG: hypothetical protein JXR97_09495 [Planctomycetes bacterium]|nr:hypothetical protein [Planctomycetota bacterium]
MSAMDNQFNLAENILVVNSPFILDERQREEDAFLQSVDKLMTHRAKDLTIDLVRAGSVSSTVIALAIAASRKADEAGKNLTIKFAKRNELAIRISGLAKLVEVKFI